LLNLLTNAVKYTPESGQVAVSYYSNGDNNIRITVSDTGPGIPPESLERIFDPFFTTKRQTLGTGLGLSISREILRRLGGELSVESVHGEGATFLCFLPIPSPEALARAGKPAATPTRAGRATDMTSVLVVEDDERVLRSYARLLGSRHRLMVACDGREAIQMLQSGSTADVLVLEVDLATSDGPELLAWLEAERPELARRTILATAGGSRFNYDEFLRKHGAVVMHKPLRGSELLAAVEAIASKRDRP